MINIKERHAYWWNYLLENMKVPPTFCKTIPAIQLETKISRKAGQANSKECVYNLCYALQEGDNYDETICHEVCHTFTMRLYRNAGHGCLWHYVYNVVCNSERGRYHSYNQPVMTPEIETIKELLKLQKKIAACTKGEQNA